MPEALSLPWFVLVFVFSSLLSWLVVRSFMYIMGRRIEGQVRATRQARFPEAVERSMRAGQRVRANARRDFDRLPALFRIKVIYFNDEDGELLKCHILRNLLNVGDKRSRISGPGEPVEVFVTPGGTIVEVRVKEVTRLVEEGTLKEAWLVAIRYHEFERAASQRGERYIPSDRFLAPLRECIRSAIEDALAQGETPPV